MTELLENIDRDTLQQIQDGFAAVAGVAIRILSPDGEPLTGASPAAAAQPGDAAEGDVPVVVNGRPVALLRADRAAEAPGGILNLMAGVIARLARRQKQLRSRVEELATLYRLAAEFNEQRDIQALLNVVAETVVAVLGAKACSIRLLSEDHSELLVKAIAGLSPEYLNKGPILLSASLIDQEVFRTGKAVYIADQRSDPRVLYPAEAAQEGIVSALCAPMSYKGRPEGAIRVYMPSVHEFDWFEVSLLQAIAAEAAGAIVNARLYQQALSLASTKRQLRLAAAVQQRMIPAGPPEPEGFEIIAEYVPCFELAGDFYDFLPLPEDNLGLAVCDVVGKGVRASLLMASIRASLRAHAANVYAMDEVMRKVNRDLCADTLSSDFATLFYGVIDTHRRLLTYANAGHVPPLLIRDGVSEQLCSGGGVLGVDPDGQWDHDVVELAGGDVLLICTDGLTEAMNFGDEYFGIERVERAAVAAVARERSAKGIAAEILWEMRRFIGLQDACDDLTLIVIRVL